jgi:hypothetical protein
MMNPTAAQFRASLIGLHLDRDGLTRQNNLERLNLIARLSGEVLDLTADADTPEDLLLHRLAHCAQRVVTTVLQSDPDAVRAFLIARAELLEADANSRPEATTIIDSDPA